MSLKTTKLSLATVGVGSTFMHVDMPMHEPKIYRPIDVGSPDIVVIDDSKLSLQDIKTVGEHHSLSPRGPIPIVPYPVLTEDWYDKNEPGKRIVHHNRTYNSTAAKKKHRKAQKQSRKHNR